MKWYKLIALLGLMCILLTTLLVFNGCVSMGRKGETAARSIQPIGIEFVSSLPSFLGSESIGLLPIIKLTNPNPFPISVEVSYTLVGNGENLGGSQLPTTYIPANGTATLRDTATFTYSGLVLGRVFGAKGTPAECVAVILPIWKGLGGKRPVDVTEKAWEEVKPASLAFVMDVASNISNGEGTNLFKKLTWSEK